MIDADRLMTASAMLSDMQSDLLECHDALKHRSVGEAVVRLLRIRKGVDGLITFLSYMPASDVELVNASPDVKP